MENTPVITVGNDSIYPLIFTPENTVKFWNNARKFPTIYGHEIVDNWENFIDLFFEKSPEGLAPRGLFWVLNDFTGVFYLSDIRVEEEDVVDALTHYTFFDRRHHGRTELVKEMLKFWFEKYKFSRLSAEIPNYTTPQARHFAQACGMSYEGKRRKATRFKGELYDVNLYGILRQEVING